MTDDLSKGIIDRFRSLPMARSAVLSGRRSSDLVYNAGILVVLMLSGLAVGWRVHTGVLEFLAGVGLLLLFTFAMSWIGVWLGLSVPTRRGGAAGLASPSSSRSRSSRTSSCRRRRCPTGCSRSPSGTRSARSPPPPASCGATRTRSPRRGFPAEHPVLLTLIWVVVLVAVFAPLGVMALPLDEPLERTARSLFRLAR